MTEAPRKIGEFRSDRLFRLWDFRVSHSQLLIRSPRAPESSENDPQGHNVDLMCLGVAYLAVPDLMHGVRVSQDSRSALELEAARIGISAIRDHRLIVIESGLMRHSIICAQLAIMRTLSPPMESSLVLHWSPHETETARYREKYLLDHVVLGGKDEAHGSEAW